MSITNTQRPYARRFTGLLAGLLLAASFTATANAATDATQAAVDATNNIRFGVPSWPGERVKAAVAGHIFDAIGYDAKATNVSWTIALKSVSLGQLDADMALWRPTQNSTLDPMLESGKVKFVTTNIEDAQYDLVVPDYVWKAGVHSIADLHKYADKFDNRIYGIEAGNDGNTLVINAIKDNTYKLGGFKLISSSTAGMLSQVKNAIRQHKWVVFLGWKPHWMNIIYDIKYLNDPKKMWGDGSTVNTVVNPSYAKSHPNAVRFLKQMTIPSDVQSFWIKAYGYENKPFEEVAETWIKQNPTLVKQWLAGVTTADGSQDAFTALQADIND